MTTCKEYQERFAEGLYDELDSEAKRALEDHLRSCPTCSEEFASMQETMSVMDKRRRIELDDKDWASFWRRLDQRLSQGEIDTAERVARPNLFHHIRTNPPAWVYGIAAMLLIAFGIYFGRTFLSENYPGGVLTPQPTTNTTAISAPSPDSTTKEALAYLERSRNLLIGVTNLDADRHSTIDLSSHQWISRRLVDQGNILAVALVRPDQQSLRELIQDLRLILLQLANLELKGGVPAVELVKQGVASKSILLKINLEEIRASLNEPQSEYLKKKKNKAL